MKKNENMVIKFWNPVFDGAGTGGAAGDGAGSGGDGAAGGSGGGAGGAGAGGSSGAAGKTFTQEDMNRVLADEKRKHQANTRKALEELEAIKAKATLTDQERQDLEGRVENMKNELLTKEELAKKEQDKITRKYTEETTKLTGERDAWQQRFTNSTIQRSITDASVVTKAFNPRQIVAILQPDTRLVEALDADGKPTGELIAKVEFSDVDKDGKPVTLDLTIEEAVKRMSEMDEYANLFRTEGVGGVGSTNSGKSGKPLDVKKIAATDPALYRKLRAEGKI